MKIVTSEQMRQIEQACDRIGIPASLLMENAGRAVAEDVKRILGGIDRQRIVVLSGPGNNGGDGLVAARYLHNWGARVTVCLCSQRAPDDQNLKLVKEIGVNWIDVTQGLKGLDELLASANVVVDALLGTGKIRPLSGTLQQVLSEVSNARKSHHGLRIIALDLPSGLDADTGAANPACLYADNTITLGFAKPGLFDSPGAEKAGKVTVVDIGIPAYLAEQGGQGLITDEWAQSILPARPIEANKGSFGRVLVVAGSINYIGAAYLACSGAIRVGAGLVTLATAASLQPILASKLTEATYLPLPESRRGIIAPEATRPIYQEMERYNVLLLGCGLGQSQSVLRFIKSILLGRRVTPPSPVIERKGVLASLLLGRKVTLPPLVLDADALNTLARIPNWWQQLTTDAILTPHPGEMAGLAGVSIDEVQSDRVGITTRLAVEWHKTIVLKGAYTVIATPDGQSRLSPFANPGMASAGTGDVLAGVIAGLLAQGLSLGDAAAGGVYLHGKAGDMVKSELGDAGMTATDLLQVLPLVIKQLKEST